MLLDPGNYHVNVTHRGHEILNEDFKLDYLRGIRFDLKSMVMFIGSPTFGDTTVEVVRDFDRSPSRPIEVKLTRADHYHASVYLYPGTYRAIARSTASSDQVVAQEDFTIDRLSQVRVDLNRSTSEEPPIPAP